MSPFTSSALFFFIPQNSQHLNWSWKQDSMGNHIFSFKDKKSLCLTVSFLSDECICKSSDNELIMTFVFSYIIPIDVSGVIVLRLHNFL